jgi:hypothetical protein
MTTKFNKLKETFNVQETEIVPEIIEAPLENLEKTTSLVDDIRRDYEYTRGNLYSIIEKGQEALNGALEKAQETESARSYEVVGQLIKTVSDATDKLIDLQKKLKDLDEKPQKGPTNVTNALFVGSTAELTKLLKNQMKNADDTK